MHEYILFGNIDKYILCIYACLYRGCPVSTSREWVEHIKLNRKVLWRFVIFVIINERLINKNRQISVYPEGNTASIARAKRDSPASFARSVEKHWEERFYA